MDTISKNAQGEHNTIQVEADIYEFALDFQNHVRQMLELIDQALQHGDLKKILEIAHKLRGNGALFGLELVTTYGTQIEEAIRSEGIDEIKSLLSKLSTYINNVKIVVSPAPKQKRILIADDVEIVRRYMAHLFSMHGYEVAVVSDGNQCLQKTKEFIPHLIILDVMMPGLHGFDVLKTIKTDPTTHDIGIIVCSAKSYKPDRDRAIELGAFDYVTKPFEQEVLLNTVLRFFKEEVHKKKWF